jgi:uncharacterized protein (TIGR02217 family)
MAHLAATLPKQLEVGAVRKLNYSTEVVTTDGGREVRNARWATPLRTYEVSFPTALRQTDPVYQAVVSLYAAALGGLHSFSFVDWTDGTGSTIVPVRFDGPLTITGIDHRLDHIDQITLTEVRL